MNMVRAMEQNSLSSSNTSQKPITYSPQLATQYEENNSNNEKNSAKKRSDSPKKSNGSWQKTLIPANMLSGSSQSIRRSMPYDGLPLAKGRSITDIQTVISLSKHLKQQQLNIIPSGSEKTNNHHNHLWSQSPAQPKPKSTLPTTSSQPGYLSPSKLFNMMGYGLQNQYLFMLAHYLYIIDCRSREQFNEKHIITGKFDLVFFTKKKISV